MKLNVDSVNYRELLLLAFFKSRYKEYNYSEAVSVLGVSYKYLRQMMEKLEKEGLLIRFSQYFVVSKEGEKLLESKRLSNIFEKREKKSDAVKMDINKIYIPKQFHL